MTIAPNAISGQPVDVPYNIRIRMLLMNRLRAAVRARQLTQVEAAAWLHVSQSRISHLVNGLVHRFTTDTLLNMLAHTGDALAISFDDRRTDAPVSISRPDDAAGAGFFARRGKARDSHRDGRRVAAQIAHFPGATAGSRRRS